MDLVYYTRCRNLKRYSIEYLFDTIAEHLPLDYKVRFEENALCGTNLFACLLSMVFASFRQGRINHISGDVHYLAILLKKSKTVLTIHDLEFYNRSSGYRKILFYLFWIWLPCKRSRYITVVSKATRSELLKTISISPSKVYVVPNFISPQFKAVRKTFNEKCPRILQIGTKANKNLPRLIDALSTIDCVLVIIGPIGFALERRLTDNKVKFEHFNGLAFENLITEYIKCDLVAVVSTEEGFGLPILEAQTVGRVVVAGNRSSLPEVAGEGAYYVNPYDTLEIRKGIEMVINKPILRNRLISEGYRNADRFSVESTIKKYNSLYQKICKGERA